MINKKLIIIIFIVIVVIILGYLSWSKLTFQGYMYTNTKDYLKEPIHVMNKSYVEIYAGIVEEDGKEKVKYFYRLPKSEYRKDSTLIFFEDPEKTLYRKKINNFADYFGEINIEYSDNQEISYHLYYNRITEQFYYDSFICNISVDFIKDN